MMFFGKYEKENWNVKFSNKVLKHFYLCFTYTIHVSTLNRNTSRKTS